MRRHRRGSFPAAAVSVLLMAVLLAPAPATAAVAVAGTTGPTRTLHTWTLGLNGANMGGPAYSDAAFAAALTSYRPGTLRYPGGTIANFFDWRTGWYRAATMRWPGQPARKVDLSLATYAGAIRATGATPLFDLNLVTWKGRIATDADDAAMLADQIAMLEAAQGLGLPITRVELGNELYLNGPNSGETHYKQRFPTVASYAATANRWADTLHARFPGVQVAAVATESNLVPNLSSRRATWDEGLFPRLSGPDAVTIHENIRATGSTAPELLARPQQQITAVRGLELAALPAGLDVWVTEFNLADQTGKWSDTWAHGLFTAELALLLLTTPQVSQAGMHNAVGGIDSAAFFTSTNALGSAGPSTVRFGRTACGTSLGVVQQALRGATSAQEATFSGGPVLQPSGQAGLVGLRLTGSGGPSLVVVNLTAAAVTVDVSAVVPGPVAVATYSAPVTSKLTGAAMVPVTSTTDPAQTVLGAFSLTVARPA